MNKETRLILESCELILQVNVGNLPTPSDKDRALKLMDGIREILNPPTNDLSKERKEIIKVKGCRKNYCEEEGCNTIFCLMHNKQKVCGIKGLCNECSQNEVKK